MLETPILSAQNYSVFLEEAKIWLDRGDCRKAEEAYNDYQYLTHKKDKTIERKIFECFNLNYNDKAVPIAIEKAVPIHEKDTDTDKTLQEEPKPATTPRALFKDKSGTGTQQGGSEGITGNPGDQGNPNGLAGIKNYSGNGGSGNGPSYKLGNRSHKSLPIPKQDFNEECTVTVDIWVNPEGKVVRAEAATKGTTTSSQKMKNMAIDAALRSTFSPDSEAPDEQHGTITYNFVINH